MLEIRVPEMKYCNWIIPCAEPEVPQALVSAGFTPLLAAMLARGG